MMEFAGLFFAIFLIVYASFFLYGGIIMEKNHAVKDRLSASISYVRIAVEALTALWIISIIFTR